MVFRKQDTVLFDFFCSFDRHNISLDFVSHFWQVFYDLL